MIDVLDAETLKCVQTLDTKGHGVFSSFTDSETNKVYLGCFGGHLFSVDLQSMSMINELYAVGGVKPNKACSNGNGHLKLTQGIYDITLLPFKPKVLMCVQHFGFIDFVAVESPMTVPAKRNDWLHAMEDSRVQLQTNTIF